MVEYTVLKGVYQRFWFKGKNMFSRMKTFLQEIAKKERCPHKLAVAASLGVYISFSPFLGLHTAMHIVFGWLFRLNIPLLLAVGYGVNNPWTMVPIHMSGYFCGYWILHSWYGLSVTRFNPTWMSYLTGKLAALFGTVKISFWAFMLGANLVGVILAFVLYPFFWNFFSAIMRKKAF